MTDALMQWARDNGHHGCGPGNLDAPDGSEWRCTTCPSTWTRIAGTWHPTRLVTEDWAVTTPAPRPPVDTLWLTPAEKPRTRRWPWRTK